jgi:hypothetical protein
MTEYPDDADGDALRRVAADADMSRPMEIDFMVAVPDEEAGQRVARPAAQRGFSVAVESDGEAGTWTCYCSRSMLATYDGVVAVQRELYTLAQPLGGRSDGWGTFGNRE